MTQVHHCHAVADMAHDGEVMGDEKVAQFLNAVLELFQKVDNLRLDGNVQRGDRLVADDEGGVAGKGARHADTLALAAGKLMGKTVSHGRVEADDAEKLLHPVLEFPSWSSHLVDFQRFADDAAGALAGVEGGIRVLEDEGDVFADVPQFLFGEGGNVFALEYDFAGGGVVKPEDAAADGGLAAAALAHEAQGFILQVSLKVTPSTALTSATLRRNKPRVTGKYIFKSDTSKIALSWGWFTSSPWYPRSSG